MKLSVPGKTYLVGEYSVLLGGAAIGIATEPSFQIEFHNTALQPKAGTQSTGEPQPTQVLHPESPAALYYKKHKLLRSFSLTDPYPHGGFGKSTAEYWAAVFPDLHEKNPNFPDLLKEYKSFHQGSGTDLAFQFYGRICLADPIIQFYQTFNWHFENLDFYILATGHKIITHEHLKNLNLATLKELPPLSNRITQVFAENREFEFLSLMKQWCAMLEKHQLVHPHSLKLKMQLESFDAIKLAKPCGALGGDVIIVFFAKSHKESVKNDLLQNGFLVQAHSSDLAPGIINQLVSLRPA